MSPLDIPVWTSLVAAPAAIAVGEGAARRYRSDVSVFAAYDPASDGSDLAALLGQNGAVLVGQPAPPGCDTLFVGEGHQMILENLPMIPAPRGLVELGPRDYTDMAQLVTATQPGPWAPNTPVVGTYLGVRRDGALVAMAGERFNPPRYREISAVCTADAARRTGLASALCSEVARRIAARGETPFLHVNQHNTSAIAVYEQLGFVRRRTITFTAVRVSGQS